MPGLIYSCRICDEVSRIHDRIMQCEAKGCHPKFAEQDRVVCTEDGRNWKLGFILSVRYEPETHHPVYLVVLDEDVEAESKRTTTRTPTTGSIDEVIAVLREPDTAKEFPEYCIKLMADEYSDGEDDSDGTHEAFQ